MAFCHFSVKRELLFYNPDTSWWNATPGFSLISPSYYHSFSWWWNNLIYSGWYLNSTTTVFMYQKMTVRTYIKKIFLEKGWFHPDNTEPGSVNGESLKSKGWELKTWIRNSWYRNWLKVRKELPLQLQNPPSGFHLKD